MLESSEGLTTVLDVWTRKTQSQGLLTRRPSAYSGLSVGLELPHSMVASWQPDF